MSSLPSLRLIYFPVRARAEAARMIVAYGGIACKDEDCNSFFGMSFPEAKKAGKLPFGQLPVLEVAGPGNKLKMIGGLSPELILSLKLGNVWVFVVLISGPLWPMNQLNKIPLPNLRIPIRSGYLLS